MINSPSSALEFPNQSWQPSDASRLYAPRTADQATPTILVVDSERQTLFRTRRVLYTAGYRVATSDTFEKAWRLLTSPQPDLLIVDIRLGAFRQRRRTRRTSAEFNVSRPARRLDRPDIARALLADSRRQTGQRIRAATSSGSPSWPSTFRPCMVAGPAWLTLEHSTRRIQNPEGALK